MIADTAQCTIQVYLPIALVSYFLVQFSTAGFSRYSEIRNGFIDIKVNEEMSRSAIYRKLSIVTVSNICNCDIIHKVFAAVT